jgi:hypothetical protein
MYAQVHPLMARELFAAGFVLFWAQECALVPDSSSCMCCWYIMCAQVHPLIALELFAAGFVSCFG